MLVLYDFCCHLLGICIGFEILGENEFGKILRTPKNILSLLLFSNIFEINQRNDDSCPIQSIYATLKPLLHKIHWDSMCLGYFDGYNLRFANAFTHTTTGAYICF